MAPEGTGWLHGLVKAVPSGDCVVVMGASAAAGPPPEKTITLASLIAPRMARRDNSTRDEPFAWDSREFLRKRLVGRRIKFRVEYVVSSIGREFGTIYVGDENVSLASVSHGWARVRPSQGGDAAANYDELVDAEREAQTREAGLWTKDATKLAAATRSPPAPETVDNRTLLSTRRGVPTPAIVEAVLNGGCLRVCLLTDELETRHATITVNVAGAQCPAMGKRPKLDAAAGGEDGTSTVAAAPEPFAREAKHFTECRLLHREVRVVFEGADKYDNLHATVLFAENGAPVDVAAALVSEGLAKVVDWSVALMTDPIAGAQRLRAAERKAKDARARIWKTYTPPASSMSALTLKAGREFAGVVIEAVSGDCLVIADASSGMERRVNLASIRAPRIGNERRGQKPEAWATEAKEFLRQRAVGHSVEVVMEYSRKIGGGGGGGGGVDVTATDAAAPERHLDFGTVSLASDGANLAEMLVMRGFASAIKHRGDDERSGRYDDILAAEQRAIKGKKGVQNRDREAPIHRVNDASATAAKAKQFLPFLQRAGKSAGVVEYVVTGHRMKIHVPKESASIAFSLAGVRCPQPPRSGSGGEPHGADALRFVRHACLQRDVEIEVDAVDKTGTFLGHLTTQGGRFNLSEELLKRGLGTLHPSFTPERHPSGESLVRAQEQAKQIRAGVWVGWSPEAEAAAAAAAAAARGAASAAAAGGGGPKETTTLGVTEVITGTTFFAQRADGDRADWLFEQLQACNANDSSVTSFAPKRGQMVAGRFTGDDAWYRAIVTEPPRNDAIKVFYCDYGNGEALPPSRVRPLDPSLAPFPPLAKLCALAGVKPAPDDFGRDALDNLRALAMGRALFSRVESAHAAPHAPWDPDASPEWTVTLGARRDEKSGEGGEKNDEDGPSVNEAMVADGYARADKTLKLKPGVFQALLVAQERARKSRAGMWEYGDVDSDDEEPSGGGGGGAWGRGRR